jgi:hypothetical protein
MSPTVSTVENLREIRKINLTTGSSKFFPKPSSGNRKVSELPRTARSIARANQGSLGKQGQFRAAVVRMNFSLSIVEYTHRHTFETLSF